MPNTPAAPASTGRSRWKAMRSAGPTARTGSRTRRRRQPSRRSTVMTSTCRKPMRSCATSPSSSIVRTRRNTASRSTPTIPMMRWRWALKAPSSATAAISATMQVTRSTASSIRKRLPPASKCTRSSTSSRLPAGGRPSSWKTTRRSPAGSPR